MLTNKDKQYLIEGVLQSLKEDTEWGAASKAFFGVQYPISIVTSILTAPLPGINIILGIFSSLFANEFAIKKFLLHKAQQCEGLDGVDGIKCKVNLLIAIKKVLNENKSKCKNSENPDKCTIMIKKYIEQIDTELKKLSNLNKSELNEDTFPFMNMRNVKSLYLSQLLHGLGGATAGGGVGAILGAGAGALADKANLHIKGFGPSIDDNMLFGGTVGGTLGALLGAFLGQIKGIDDGVKRFYLQSAIQCDELSGNAKVNCKIELLKGMKTELVKSSKKCKDEKCIRKFNFYISRIENELRNLE